MCAALLRASRLLLSVKGLARRKLNQHFLKFSRHFADRK
jgi:hypothetical protein